MPSKSCGLTSIVWLAFIGTNTPAIGQAANRIFILEIPERGLLCGYTSEREWSQLPREKKDTDFVAVISSVDGVVSSILVERFTEETAVYDEYSIDRAGNVRQLKRTLDVVPDRVTREETWTIRAGRAVKVSESWTEFKTHRPIDPHKDVEDFGIGPIMLRISDFPFNVLIADKHPERWTERTRCVPGNMNNLEAKLPK